MHETKLSAKDVVLHHLTELNDHYAFDYLDLIKNNMGQTTDNMYKTMLDKKLLS
jgi:hypothetical protein